MKRKALLLIIPFAAAGLAGCQPANPNPPAPQCDPTGATINKTALTIHIGDVDDSVVANAPSGCTFSWSSNNEAVATVSAQGEITGVAVGTAVIKFADASGQGVSCTVTVVPVDQHIHTFSDEWSKDENYHWHAATCGHDVVDSQGAHVDEVGDDGKCDVCGYDMSHVVVSSMKEAYEAAAALENDEKTEEAYEFTGIVTAIMNGNGGDTNYYTQDGVYAIDVFKKGGKLDGVKVGSKIKVKATMQKFSDVIETETIQSLDVLGDEAVPAPLAVSSYDALASAKLNVLAKITGTVKDFAAPVSGKDYSLKLTVGGQDVTVFTKKSIIASLIDSLSSLSDGTEVTIDNAVTAIHGTTYQLLTTNASTVTVSGQPVEPAINLDKYEAKIAKDESVTINATVIHSEETVSWSIASGEGNISIAPNGNSCVVTGLVAGTSAAVKAELGTTGKSKTCNITVKGETPVIEGIVLDFENDLTKESGEKDGVSYVSAKGTDGKSDPAYNTDNKELRLYASNTFTVSAASDITKISFDYNGCYTPDGYCKKANGDIASVSVGTFANGVWTGSAKSVTFTMSAEGQVHIHKVGVVCGPVKTLTDLTIKTQPSKVDYNEGETFSAEGLVLTATYSEGDPEEITSGWTISPAGALSASDNKVTVSYGGKSVDVDITVTARELQSIEITSGMSEKNYVAGESWNAAGIVVTGTYNLGDPTVIDSSKYDLTFTPEAPALGVTSVSIVASMKDGSKTSEAFNQTGISVTEAPADPVIGQTFNKISSTAELSDGVYMIVYEDTTGSKVSDGGEGPVDATIENNSIVGVKGQGAFEIKAMTGGYSIKSLSGEKAGKYLSGTNDKNTTNFNDAAVANEITVTDGVADIVSGTSHLRYNSGASMFRYYKASSYSSQGSIALYKQGAPVDPAVNGVTVTPETATIEVEGTTQLAAVVDAVGGASQKVNWSSSNENIATVDENGLVTAVAQGTATITATSDFDKVTADSCSITVEPKSAPEIVSVTVSPDSEDVYVGDTLQLTPTVNVKGGAAQTVTYTSDKESVATVSNSGLVTGVGDGTAHITVASTVTPSKYAVATITVSTRTAEHGTTENDPLNADEAYAISDKLESEAVTDNEYYIEGTVSKINAAYSAEHGNISLDLKTSDGNTFVLYRVRCTQSDADSIVIGTLVKVKAKISRYNSTRETNTGGSFVSISNQLSAIEISGSAKIQKGTKSTYTAAAVPSVASLGTVTWSIDSGESYISLPETKTGSSIEVTAVAAGNAVLKATSGDVSKIFAIIVSEEETIDPYEGSFSKNTKGNTKYDGTFEETINDIKWKCGGNNTVDGGFKMSTGKTTNTNDRVMYNEDTFENPVSKFVVVTGKKDADAIVNSVTLFVYDSLSDLEAGTNQIDSVTGTYTAESEIVFDKPAGSDWDEVYFKVVFNLGNSNAKSNNGIYIAGVRVEF